MSRTYKNSIRNENDYYPTPLYSFIPILGFLDINREYYEPSCGDKRLINTMIEYGFNCTGTDINEGNDYLEDFTHRDVIITNPPFSLAFEFCKHARLHSTTIYFLLRLNFLGSQTRKSWFIQNEPDFLCVLSKRPSFTGKGTDATEYAWVGWNSHYKGIFHV